MQIVALAAGEVQVVAARAVLAVRRYSWSVLPFAA
jgi:hypothetical protein